MTSGGNIVVHLGAFGATECGHANPATTDANGVWTAPVHWYFNTDDMAGSTTLELQTCAVHEFGHALGLDHYQAANCSNVQMMDGLRVPNEGPPYTNNDFWTCGYSVPRLGDRGGVNALY